MGLGSGLCLSQSVHLVLLRKPRGFAKPLLLIWRRAGIWINIVSCHCLDLSWQARTSPNLRKQIWANLFICRVWVEDFSYISVSETVPLSSGSSLRTASPPLLLIVLLLTTWTVRPHRWPPTSSPWECGVQVRLCTTCELHNAIFSKLLQNDTYCLVAVYVWKSGKNRTSSPKRGHGESGTDIMNHNDSFLIILFSYLLCK